VPALVRSEQPDGHFTVLCARVAELERGLGERSREVATLARELAAFRIDYAQRVGRLHEELDDLEAAIAKAELGDMTRRLEDSEAAPVESAAPAPPDPLPRYTSDAVRKLFRDVAKAIHPDLAEDEDTRDRRHALMIEANRAYALGDGERLRWILQSWEDRPEAVEGCTADAARARLVRRIARLEEQIAIVDRNLGALRDSPMGKLKAMVDDAAANGKDLVRDMVARLKGDVLIARNRLQAIEFTP
jgi:hypothetical protein